MVTATTSVLLVSPLGRSRGLPAPAKSDSHESCPVKLGRSKPRSLRGCPTVVQHAYEDTISDDSTPATSSGSIQYGFQLFNASARTLVPNSTDSHSLTLQPKSKGAKLVPSGCQKKKARSCCAPSRRLSVAWRRRPTRCASSTATPLASRLASS